jgi:uncharacterized protein YecT (DUF1311 family)
MKNLIFPSIFCMFLVSSGASAQVGNPSRAEVSILRTCVDTAQPKNIYSSCFGALQVSCVRRMRDESMFVDSECISYEKRAWAQILQETVRSVLEHRDVTFGVTVRRSQAAWAASQVADKNAVLKSFEGGSGAGAQAELAESKGIAKRIQFLYEHLQ